MTSSDIDTSADQLNLVCRAILAAIFDEKLISDGQLSVLAASLNLDIEVVKSSIVSAVMMHEKGKAFAMIDGALNIEAPIPLEKSCAQKAVFILTINEEKVGLVFDGKLATSLPYGTENNNALRRAANCIADSLGHEVAEFGFVTSGDSWAWKEILNELQMHMKTNNSEHK